MMMNITEAKQVVDDMLSVCQKLRSNIDDPIYGVDFSEWGDDTKIKADLYPWLYGDKDIRPTLIDLATGVKPITGQTVYNLMFVAHRLCPAIALLAPLRLPDGRELPEPCIEWCAGTQLPSPTPGKNAPPQA